MSAEENIAVVRRHLEEAVRHNRPELVEELFDPDYVLYNGERMIETGLEGVRKAIANVHAVWEEYENPIVEIVANDNVVVTRQLVTAKQRGSYTSRFYPPVAPSGKTVTYPVVMFYTLREGKIVAGRGYGDEAAVLNQLGAFPPNAGV